MISEYKDEYEDAFQILLKKKGRLKINQLWNSKRKTKLKITKKSIQLYQFSIDALQIIIKIKQGSPILWEFHM